MLSNSTRELLVSINGNEFTVSTFQFDAIWQHIAAGNWEKQSFEIFDYFIEPDDVVLDIGAWAGPFTLYAANLGKEIFALDPDPVIFPQLCHNVSLNEELSSKVTCINASLWTKTGEEFLYCRNDYGSSSSSLLNRVHDSRKRVAVQALTFADLIAKCQIRKLNFIKMDIEGGEYELIPTMRNSLEALDYPTLYVSFHESSLNEQFYLSKIKHRFLSRVVMKVEQILGLRFFHHQIKEQTLDVLATLKDYAHVYTDNGESVSFSRLFQSPGNIRNNCFVFTMREWCA